MTSNLIDLLVIEDNPGDFFFLKESLRMTAIRTGEILNAERLSAIQDLIKGKNIDLVFLDLSLPDSSGQDSVNALMRIFPTIPVIVLSGMSDVKLAMECIALGAQDYLIKGEYDTKILEKSIQYSIERKKNQEKIRASNERYELVVNKATHDVIWEWDMEKNLITRSNAATLLLEDDSFISQSGLDSWFSIVHPEDRSSLQESVDRTLSEHQETWSSEYRIQTASGKIKHVLDRGYLIYGKNEAPIRMVGAVMDITDRKRLEKELISQHVQFQKEITESTLAAEEKQKNDLAIELHDNINQILATAKMYLSILKSNNTPEQASELVEQSYEFINTAIEEIRKLSHSLAAPSIGEAGLGEALKELAADWNPVSDFKISVLDSMPADFRLNPVLEIALYRIVQEQLTNIMKYSKAKLVQVDFFEENGKLNLMITDDGVGFDLKKKSRGIGLKNIQSRVDFFGGSFDITTSPGEGCRLEIRIPVKAGELVNSGIR